MRGEWAETERRQNARRTDVPRIREDECAILLMERAEDGAFRRSPGSHAKPLVVRAVQRTRVVDDDLDAAFGRPQVRDNETIAMLDREAMAVSVEPGDR